MLENGSPAAETAPANTSPAPPEPAAPLRVPALEKIALTSDESSLPSEIRLEPQASHPLLRYYLAEQTWTFAYISSATLHFGAVVCMLVAALIWNWLDWGALLPPGAVAGGRPAGSNSAGIIGVMPGRLPENIGEAEQTGGIITLLAPQQLGNLSNQGLEVDGEILEAKKLTQTSVQTVAPPIETRQSPETEVAITPTETMEPTRTIPPPPVAELLPTEPITTLTKRLPDKTLAPTVIAQAIVPSPAAKPDATEYVPQVAVAKAAESPDNQPTTPPSPKPVEMPPVEPVLASTPTPSPSEKSEVREDDAPMSEVESPGVARRRGTQVVAKSDTTVELDFIGEGGGAGGPGGSGGAGGRGGTANDGPGGTGASMTHGGGGDLRSLVLSAPEPIYPRELVAARITGRVSVRVEIDREGKVIGVRVHQPSGHDAFDKSALEAIARWRFARLVDKPWRGSVYIVPVRFKIYE